MMHDVMIRTADPIILIFWCGFFSLMYSNA